MIIDGTLNFKNKNRQAIKKDLTKTFESSIIDNYVNWLYFYVYLSEHITELLDIKLWKKLKRWEMVYAVP